MTARVPVVISGAAAVSPLGASFEAAAESLLAGISRVGPLTNRDVADWPVKIGAEVQGWTPKMKRHERIGEMLAHVIEGALSDAAMTPIPSRTALVVGLGRQPPLEPSAAIDSTLQDVASLERLPSILADRFRCRGPIYACANACASGNDVIGIGRGLLRQGVAEVVIAGASDSQLSRCSVNELANLKVLARPRDEGDRVPKPFDKNRNGFAIGEGAAAFVLETLTRAEKRGARVRAEVVGYASAASAFSLTRERPDGGGALRAILGSLEDAELSPRDIDYVNAHGTATIANDIVETRAIKAAFGDHALSVPVSSTKALSGHALAASAAIELAYCLIALERNFVPPTVNFETPDPECDLDYVTNQSRSHEMTTIMSNAFGFGGQSAVLIIRRVTS